MFLSDVLRLALWLAILVIVFVPLEHWFAVQPHKALRKQVWVDLCYYFLNSLLPVAILSIPAAILGWASLRLLPGAYLDNVSQLPFWAKATVGLVVGETGYYWGHRLSHHIPFLWRFHAVHHSAEEMDFLVNTRAHPLDMVFSRTCALIPIYAFGLAGTSATPKGAAVPVVVTLIGTMWSFFVHANIRWKFGPLEWLVVTPKFHHWHHTRDGQIDCNYSSTLPWLDRIFGTHRLPEEWPEAYGIEQSFPTTLLDQLCYPFVREETPGTSDSEKSNPIQ